MKYAHIDSNHKILGWYDPEMHSNIPNPNIKVTDEVWLEAINSGHNKVNPDGTTELFDFRTEEEIKEEFERNFRIERDRLLVEVVDFYQRTLVWESLSEEQQNKVRGYRLELLESTNSWVMPDELVL